MIEPTEEMVEAFLRGYADADDGSSGVILDWTAERAGLAAVLAIVERDYAIMPQACCEPAPGEPMAYCELAEGHRGKHSATVEKAMDW